MPGHLELFIRRVRENLQENGKLRYKRFTTTTAGASTGATIVSSSLTEVDDAWIGTECAILDGDFEGQRRFVEDSAQSTGTLSFTNDVFPGTIGNNVTCELTERGFWSGEDIKHKLIESINFLASSVPKAVLRDYIRPQSVSSVAGLADAPSSPMVDIAFITINSKPAIQIAPEELSRFITNYDVFIPPTTSDRYLYFWQGKDSDEGQLRHQPAVNATVTYHYIPLFTDFDSSGNTTFPDELHDLVILYTTYCLWLANQDVDFAGAWAEKFNTAAQARGFKVRIRSKQEIGES